MAGRLSEVGGRHPRIPSKACVNELLIEFEFGRSAEEEEEEEDLPNLRNCFQDPLWDSNCFSELRDSLLKTKSKLNDKDVHEWGLHTGLTDLSSFLLSEIRTKLERPPPFLNGAWLKFYQLLSHYPILHLEKSSCIKALFLCEAPGGFVDATNHYIRTNSPSASLDWLASSLNPYHEDTDPSASSAIVDDRFIRCSRSYPRWFFGSDNTGDIFKPSFVDSLRSKSGSDLDLITADGGISCVDFPERQESLSFPLALNQALIALSCLKRGGSFVIKLFSLLEIQTICLTYLLHISFKSVIASKPFASKSGNSEIYLVCLGYKESGLKSQFANLLARLRLNYEIRSIYKLALLSRDLVPREFLAQAAQCGALFKEAQEAAILRNLELFQNLEEAERRRIIRAKKYLARRFLRDYNLTSLDESNSICSQLEIESNKQVEPRFNLVQIRKCTSIRGSYNKRKLDSDDLYQSLKSALDKIYDLPTVVDSCSSWLDCPNGTARVQLKLLHGRSYDQVKCSKFCDLSLLCLYNRLKEKTTPRSLVLTKSSSVVKSFSKLAECLMSEYLSLSPKAVNQVIACDSYSKYTAQLFSELLTNVQGSNSNCLTLELSDTGELLQVTNKVSGGRKFFLVDSFSFYRQTQLASNGKLARHATFSRLIDNIRRVLNNIDKDDLLVLHLLNQQCLQRLTVGLIHLVYSISDKMAVLPCLLAAASQSDSQTLELQGQVYMFSFSTKLVELQKAAVEEQLKSIATESERRFLDLEQFSGKEELLELIPVPNLLQDATFSRALYAANVIHLTETLKIMSDDLASKSSLA